MSVSVEENFDHYHFTESAALGQGAFGTVYRAINKITAKYIALKKISLPHPSADSESEIQSIEREIHVMKNLNHENIVRYLGCHRNLKHLYILLEYVSGGTLSQCAQQYHGFNEYVLRIYLTQILKGLEYLHTNKIIHRDIKSGNILIDGSGTKVKLSDFGASKLLSASTLTKNTALRGTPHFLSPEAIKENKIGYASDIWAVGCTIVEMLTGRPPYYEETKTKSPFQVIFYIGNQKEPPRLPYNISSSLREFLGQCFAMDHTKRPTCTELLSHPFIQTTPVPSSLSLHQWNDEDAAELSPLSSNSQIQSFAFDDTFESQGMGGI